MTDKIFAEGFIAKAPHDNAPDFVKCSISVKVSEAVEFLTQHEADGWCNLQIKVGKSGKWYMELDTWKPTQGTAGKQGIAQAKQAAAPVDVPAFEDDDMPF